MIRRDAKATAEAHFSDPKSYITPDGREILFKADWHRRLEELQERSKGKCEECSRPAAHAHHVLKRSIERDDRLLNLQALCHTCHAKKHPEKQVRWTA
jgi:5-methylcytosine-specific restriction endonuclease McrA